MKKLFLVGPVFILLLWIVLTTFKIANPLFLPTPWATFSRLFELISSQEIFPDIGRTASRWFWGYTLGCLVGIPIGILMGLSKKIYNSLEFAIDFFRSLPVTAVFPLFLLVFGIGDKSKVAMTFTAVVFIVILNSAYGVIQTKKTRIRAAKTFGASNWKIFRYVVFFEALPHTVVGMRASLSLALVVVVVSEMFIGTQFGLGQRIYDAYTRNSIDALYAVILLLGLIGYLSNRLFVLIERKVVFWAGK